MLLGFKPAAKVVQRAQRHQSFAGAALVGALEALAVGALQFNGAEFGKKAEIDIHRLEGTGRGILDLADDVAAKRSAAGDGPAVTLTATDHFGRWTVDGIGDPVPVTQTLAGIAAYLTGRAPGEPALPRWL